MTNREEKPNSLFCPRLFGLQGQQPCSRSATLKHGWKVLVDEDGLLFSNIDQTPSLLTCFYSFLSEGEKRWVGFQDYEILW